MYIQNDPLSIQYNNIAVLLYLEGNSDQSLYLYDGVTKTHMQDHMLLEETQRRVI